MEQLQLKTVIFFFHIQVTVRGIRIQFVIDSASCRHWISGAPKSGTRHKRNFVEGLSSIFTIQTVLKNLVAILSFLEESIPGHRQRV